MSNKQKTLSHVMEELGFGKFHYWLFLVCTTSWMQDTLGIVNISILITELSSSFDITNQQKTFFAPLFMLGMSLGSSLGGFFSDKFGRIWVFKKAPILTAIGCLFLTLSFEPILLFSGIFLFGIGTGTQITIGGVVFQQFCPPSKQWVLFLLSTAWNIGGGMAALAAFIFFYLSVPFQLWKGCIAVNLAFCFITFGIRLNFLETPMYLYSQYQKEETQKTLKWVALKNRKKVDITLIQPNDSLDVMGSYNQPLLPNPEKVTIWKILTGQNLVPTLIFSTAFLSFNFGFSFLQFFMPELLDQAGIQKQWVYVILFCQNICGFLGVIFASGLIEGRLGRKYTLIIAVILEVICVLSFMFTSNFYVLMGVTSCSQMLGSICWSGLFTISPESYKTFVRNFAVGWCNACAKLGGIFGPLVCGLILKDGEGFYASIIIAASAIALNAGSLSFVKETRGIGLRF